MTVIHVLGCGYEGALKHRIRPPDEQSKSDEDQNNHLGKSNRSRRRTQVDLLKEALEDPTVDLDSSKADALFDAIKERL